MSITIVGSGYVGLVTGAEWFMNNGMDALPASRKLVIASSVRIITNRRSPTPTSAWSRSSCHSPIIFDGRNHRKMLVEMGFDNYGIGR
jgi:hypothetical protein